MIWNINILKLYFFVGIEFSVLQLIFLMNCNMIFPFLQVLLQQKIAFYLTLHLILVVLVALKIEVLIQWLIYMILIQMVDSIHLYFVLDFVFPFVVHLVLVHLVVGNQGESLLVILAPVVLPLVVLLFVDLETFHLWMYLIGSEQEILVVAYVQVFLVLVIDYQLHL